MLGPTRAAFTAALIVSFCVGFTARADEPKKSAKPRSAPADDGVQKRIAELEDLVKRQQESIEELKRQNGGNGTGSGDDALKKRVDDLENLVAKLQGIIETLQKGKPEEKTKPEAKAEVESGAMAQPTIPTTGGEKQLPDISIVTNSSGLFGSSRIPNGVDRNRFLVNEVELAFQGYLYPSIRADAFISFGRGGNELRGVAEEAFFTFLQTPITGLSLKGGKMHVDFGKRNKIHAEKLLTQDRPALLRNLLGEDNFNGHGAELSYLLPTPRGTFAQLQLGWYRPSNEISLDATGLETGTTGARIGDKLLTSRLWTSKAFGDSNEVEMGLSSMWGRGVLGGSGFATEDPINVYGADFTWRRYLSNRRRLLLSAEWMQHSRVLTSGRDNRRGYYVLGAYQMSPYWDLGLRLDNTGVPAPSFGHESATVGYLTHHLTETTFLRYQLSHGRRADGTPYNQFGLQFVWGIGPHAHGLE